MRLAPRVFSSSEVPAWGLAIDTSPAAIANCHDVHYLKALYWTLQIKHRVSTVCFSVVGNRREELARSKASKAPQKARKSLRHFSIFFFCVSRADGLKPQQMSRKQYQKTVF
jgi:hypothetical protein